jgi:murein L,D-transpeptidase YafK
VHRAELFFVLVLALVAVIPTALRADGMDDVLAPAIPYYLEIDKSDRLLRVKWANETYRQFTVAWGRGGPGRKRRQGDKRTPEGIYRIVGFNDSDKFHFFMRLNYPNVKDAFYGLNNKLITQDEFDRIIESLKSGGLPPQDTELGGAIGIHGVGEENEKKLKIHSRMNWTQGCMALTNAEISELRNYVSIGTEVVIKE